MIFLGIDPGSQALGWSVLAPNNGEYALCAYGKFNPTRIAEKTGVERYRVAYEGVKDIITKLGIKGLVAVEYTAIGAFSARSMEVTLSMSMAARAAAWSKKLETINVYPRSWQAMIKIQNADTKEASRFLAEEMYQGIGLSEDTCDSIAIAHWASIMRRDLPWLDEKTRLLEEGVSEEDLYKLGRDRAERVKKNLHSGTMTKEKSDEFIFEMRAYQARLDKHRKSVNATPKSKIKIDGNMPQKSKSNNDDFKNVAEAFNKFFK